jgi:hypothetical protein
MDWDNNASYSIRDGAAKEEKKQNKGTDDVRSWMRTNLKRGEEIWRTQQSEKIWRTPTQNAHTMYT